MTNDNPPLEPPSLDHIDDLLKEVIHDLYTLQTCAHGYLGPDTHQALIRKIRQLTTSLTTLTQTTSTLPVLIPPEIIDYVETGRNPDIYTRDFVELVQRGNLYLRGKSEALAGFRDELAREMEAEWPEWEGCVRGVVGAGGGGAEMEGGRVNGVKGEGGA